MLLNLPVDSNRAKYWRSKGYKLYPIPTLYTNESDLCWPVYDPNSKCAAIMRGDKF
jgi:hypothetical protein